MTSENHRGHPVGTTPTAAAILNRNTAACPTADAVTQAGTLNLSTLLNQNHFHRMNEIACKNAIEIHTGCYAAAAFIRSIPYDPVTACIIIPTLDRFNFLAEYIENLDRNSRNSAGFFRYIELDRC
jgi:hypothetical protein